MIEVRGVSKRYGSVLALDNVSLQVPQGSVLGLLGQNGAGKTTLLNILTGYLAATSGGVLIEGYDPLLEPAEAKSHLGYMPEHPPLYDEMTVWEYLCFASRLKGVTAKAARPHVREIMEKTGLVSMKDRLLGHLSKGYRQRAGLAQALCGDPEVLVLDEPTAGLDPKQISEIRAFIHRLAEGRTIIFSSHILSEVQQLCDHVVILHHGQVKLDMPLAGQPEGQDVTLLCTLAAEEKKIVPALQGLPGVRQVLAEPGHREGETRLRLVFDQQGKPEEALFTLASGLAVPILRLARQEDSLEAVFLRAIAE